MSCDSVYIMFTVIGRSIGLQKPASIDPMTPLFACAKIKLVKPNDPQRDVLVAFPESSDFDR